MPNWADTYYHIYGGEKEVMRFYELLKAVYEDEHVEGTYFQQEWEGRFLKALGYTDEDFEKVDEYNNPIYYCRGMVVEYDKPEKDDKGEWYLTVHCEEAWCAMGDCFKRVMAERFPTLKYAYDSREDGNDYYEVCDPFGSQLSERFLYCVDDGMDYVSDPYYETEEQVLRAIENDSGLTFKSIVKALKHTEEIEEAVAKRRGVDRENIFVRLIDGLA